MRLLDIVTVSNDLPEHRLLAGRAGTLVEKLDGQRWLVEFAGATERRKSWCPFTRAFCRCATLERCA
jgi:hypothetical protein